MGGGGGGGAYTHTSTPHPLPLAPVLIQLVTRLTSTVCIRTDAHSQITLFHFRSQRPRSFGQHQNRDLWSDTTFGACIDGSCCILTLFRRGVRGGRGGGILPTATLDVNNILILKQTLPRLVTVFENYLATI